MSFVTTLRQEPSYRGQIVRVLCEASSASATAKDAGASMSDDPWALWLLEWRKRPQGLSVATAPPATGTAQRVGPREILVESGPPGADRMEAITEFCIWSCVAGEAPVLVLVPSMDAVTALATTIRNALLSTFQWPGRDPEKASDGMLFQVGCISLQEGVSRADEGDLQDFHVLVSTYHDYLAQAESGSIGFARYLVSTGAVAVVAPESLDETTLGRVGHSFAAIRPAATTSPRLAAYIGAAADAAAAARQALQGFRSTNPQSPRFVEPDRSITVLWWQPPLDAPELTLETDAAARFGAFASVSRRDFGAELSIVCRVGLAAVHGPEASPRSRVVIVESAIGLGSHRRAQLEAELARRHSSIQLKVTRSLEDLPADWFGTVDLLVSLGWEWGDKELLRLSRATLREGGAAIAIMIETAESFARSRPEERGGRSLSEARRLLLPSAGPYAYVTGPELFAGEKSMTARDPNGAEWQLSPTEYLLEYYPGAVVQRTGNRYVAGRPIGARGSALALSFAEKDVAPDCTIPALQFALDGVTPTPTGASTTHNVRVTPVVCDSLTATCCGFRSLPSVARPEQFEETTFPHGSAPQARYGMLPGVLLECQSAADAQAIGSLLSIYVGAEYPEAFGEVAFVPAGEMRLVVVPMGPSGAALVAHIRDHVDSLLGQAGKFGWALATACWCADGCPRCVRPVLLPFTMSTSAVATKKNVLELAGRLGGVTVADVAARTEYLSAGLTDARLDAFLRGELRSAMAALTVAFDIQWKPVPVIRAGDPGLMKEKAGLYQSQGDQATIMVTTGMPAAMTLVVVAHELAHHYQETTGGFDIVGFEQEAAARKVDPEHFLEGFADWLAFRALDSAGLVSQASQIALSPDGRHGEGMRWWLELESRVGAGNVLELARNAGKAFATPAA